jgi:hypothetical protein
MDRNYLSDKYKMSSLDKKDTSGESKNKYFSFNQSLHTVMATINRKDPKCIKDIRNIDNLLCESWKRDGYESKAEEEAYFIKGLLFLSNYISNPLDVGIDNIIVNKTLRWQIKNNNTLNCKIDKVFETKNGALEVVDYKTGRRIIHTDNFGLDLRTSIYIVLLYENLKVLPDAVSYYYLRPNKKFTRSVSELDLQQSYKKIYDHYRFIRETLHLDLRHIPYASYY